MRRKLVRDDSHVGFLAVLLIACRGMLRASMTVCVLVIAYYVAFGPHGPRTPISPPGTVIKTLLGTLGLLGVSGILFFVIRAQGMLKQVPVAFVPILTRSALAAPPPPSLTKEWQEASNERAIEQKANPITGCVKINLRILNSR
jgi:hypothetical protein